MRPLIVTAAVVLDLEGRMLLGKKVNSGLYGPPGGKLDEDEFLKAGCARELREETSLKVQLHNLVELGFCERTDKHQLVFWYWVTQYKGTPTNVEPDKCQGWQFMDIPTDKDCIQGLRIFKKLHLTTLMHVTGIKMRGAA